MDIDRIHKAINRREYVRHAERRMAALRNGYQLPVSLMGQFCQPLRTKNSFVVPEYHEVCGFTRTSGLPRGPVAHKGYNINPSMDLLDVLRAPR